MKKSTLFTLGLTLISYWAFCQEINHDIKNGEWKEYYENGKLKTVGNYLNEKKNGQWTTYDVDGQIETDSYYVEGKLNGECKSYHKNGQIHKQINFKDGKRVGESKEFYVTGQVSRIIKYENDNVETTIYSRYFENGEFSEKKITENTEDGGYKSTYYYSNGNIKTIEIFNKNREKNGNWQWFSENGKIEKSCNYKNGKYNGEWKSYHENGQLKKIGNYLNGEWADGDADRPQSISSPFNYDQGKIGEWKCYYPNGNLRWINIFINDQKNGQWKYYGENGKLNQIILYKDGKIIKKSVY